MQAFSGSERSRPWSDKGGPHSSAISLVIKLSRFMTNIRLYRLPLIASTLSSKLNMKMILFLAVVKIDTGLYYILYLLVVVPLFRELRHRRVYLSILN